MAGVEEMPDALIEDCKKTEDVVDENWLLTQLTKRVLERAMQAVVTVIFMRSIRPTVITAEAPATGAIRKR